MIARYSRRKAIVIAMVALAIAAAAGWTATHGLDGEDRIAAIAVAVFATLVAVQSLRRAGNQEPIIVISPEGFHDTRTRTGVIPWSEIAAIDAVSVRRQPFLALHLRNPEIYLKEHSEATKLLGKAEAALGLGDLPVGCANLDHSVDDIVAACLVHVKR